MPRERDKLARGLPDPGRGPGVNPGLYLAGGGAVIGYKLPVRPIIPVV
jgi:hypothetical protein